MSALLETAQRQAVWSQTANSLRASSSSARGSTLAFTILGAILAMVASQLPEGTARLSCAMIGAALFAAATFVTARLLGQEKIAAWVRSRGAAEALKSESYKYAAHAAPYDGADRDIRLNAAREQIENEVSDLLGDVVEVKKPGTVPTADLAPDQYIEQRIRQQITGFFEPKAAAAARQLKRFRVIEFVLALSAACITGIVGAIGKTALAGNASPGWGFDFVALATILTTISGAILVHIEAERYESLVAQYRATARRLRDLLASAPGNFTAPSPEWSSFVARGETILLEEKNAWAASWSKP